MEIDDQGRLNLSRKALLPKPEGWTPPPPREGGMGGGGRPPRRPMGGGKRF